MWIFLFDRRAWVLVVDIGLYVPLLQALRHIERIAETKLRPAFGPVVKVTIDKSLGLAFRLAADLDYIMRIHSLTLSPLTLLFSVSYYLDVRRTTFGWKFPEKSNF
jgi:hypothetical protein